MHVLPVFLRLPLAAILIVANIVVHVGPLLAIALIKLALPFERFRVMANPWLTGIAESWIAVNTAVIALFTRTRFVATEQASLRRDGHYLVLSNHQSWVDIFVMQKQFNRRIPLLRFFLKRELFWVPLMGLAWWALDFPFMRRYTREQVARRPELAGRDIETTRRACEKFRSIPVAVMNFVEGTRFSEAKHAAQQSPYRHLLKPKSGGVAFVLDAMGEGLHSLLDLTLVYPAGIPTVVDLFAGRIPQVLIDVRERPIPTEFIGADYQNDVAHRERFQQWINALWAEKDATCARLLADAQAADAVRG